MTTHHKGTPMKKNDCQESDFSRLTLSCVADVVREAMRQQPSRSRESLTRIAKITARAMKSARKVISESC